MATAYHMTGHGDAVSQHWDRSVPIPDENSSFHQQTIFANNPYAFGFVNEPTQPDQNDLRDSNRTLRSQRSGNMNMYAHDTRPINDPHTPQPRRPSVTQSKNEAPRRKPSVGTATGTSTSDERVEDSAWIHRDKLAQIESREMAQAGIRVPHSARNRDGATESRSASRSASRARNQSRDRYQTNDDPPNSALPSFHGISRHDPATFQSTPTQYQDDDDNLDYDPAMLQIISPADRNQQSYNRSMTRPNTSTASRIPVARASPAPLPNAVVERDSPLPRSKLGGSVGERMSYQTHRARSQSLDSQGVMEGVIGSRNSTSSRARPASSHIQSSPRNSLATKDHPSRSPSKSKNAVRQTSSLAGRKGPSSTRVTPRSRTSSSARRDSPPSTKTTTGSTSRPVSNSKRPQGDAPWLATMYKPDPRLPPDQQLLPTHAKRMLQPDWERDSKTGDAHDRDFNLLNDNDLAKMGAFPSPSPALEKSPELGVPSQPPSEEQPGFEPPWPLTSNNSEARSDNNSRQPSTGGGYKITPTIPLPNPSPTPSARPAVSPQPPVIQKQSVQRVPDLDEKANGKKEKTCGCCIMM